MMTEAVEQYADWNTVEDGYPDKSGMYQIAYRTYRGVLAEREARFINSIFDDNCEKCLGFFEKVGTKGEKKDLLLTCDVEEIEDVEYWQCIDVPV